MMQLFISIGSQENGQVFFRNYWCITRSFRCFATCICRTEQLNRLRGLSAIGELTFLESLELGSKTLRSEQLGSLSKLKKLKKFNLEAGKLKHLKFLSGLNELNHLSVDQAFKDLSPLKGLMKLNSLFVKGSTVSACPSEGTKQSPFCKAQAEPDRSPHQARYKVLDFSEVAVGLKMYYRVLECLWWP